MAKPTSIAPNRPTPMGIHGHPAPPTKADAAFCAPVPARYKMALTLAAVTCAASLSCHGGTPIVGWLILNDFDEKSY